MKKIIYFIIVFIISFLIKIPPYIELNNLAIIETIAIEEKDNSYTVYLKELIPIKNDQGIKYNYKYYEATSKSIDKAISKIKKEASKKLYFSKVKKIITNIKNTDHIKKELDIKPNSIIHTNKRIKKIIKD